MNYRLLRFALFLSTVATTSTLAANLIRNGGFEQPVTSTFTEATAPDQTTIPSWDVTGGSVDVVSATGNGFDVGPAFEGAQYLDLNGISAGTISQVFPTSSGSTYLLQFAYANNYDPPTSLTANVIVTGVSSTLLSTSVTHDSSTAGNLDWTTFDQTFTADGASATLTFVSQNSGNGGVFLDAISIVQVPKPPTLTATATVNVAHTEAGTPGVFTLSLSVPPSTKTVIKYTLKGSAVNGEDYDLLSGKAKIKPGKSSTTVQVVPKGGSAAGKTVKLVITPDYTFTVGNATAPKVKIKP